MKNRNTFITILLLVLVLTGCTEPAKKLYVEGEVSGSMGKWEEARVSYFTLLETYPESRFAPSSLLKLGDIFGYVDKDFESALEMYDSLVLNYPQSDHVPDALLRKAEILIEKRQDVMGSMETLERVYQGYPDCKNRDRLIVLMSRCLEAKESFTRERAYLLELIREYPGSKYIEEACYLYGMACLGDGLADESLLAFKNILAKYPGGRFAARAEIGYAEALKEKVGTQEAANYLAAVMDRYVLGDRNVIQQRIRVLKNRVPLSKIRIPGRRLGRRR